MIKTLKEKNEIKFDKLPQGDDPRKVNELGKSLLIEYLDKGSFDEIVKIAKYCKDKNLDKLKLEGDDYTIASIYDAITREHQFNTEDLLYVLGDLYTGIDEFF